MSLSYVIYLNEDICQEELFDYIVKLGGKVQSLSDRLLQCMIEENGEIVWISHDQSSFKVELEVQELIMLKKDFGIVPKTSIIISIGKNNEGERSVGLVKKFCQSIFIKFPSAVVGICDTYYNVQTINDIKDK